MRVHARACVYACVCVRACVRACICVCVCVYAWRARTRSGVFVCAHAYVFTVSCFHNFVHVNCMYQRRIQTGARGARAPTSRKKRSLIFFCAPARGTQQANVREQRLVNARTSATARRQFYSFRRLSVCLAWDWPRRAKFLLGLLSRFRHLDKPVPDSQNERTCAQTEPDEDIPPSGFNTEIPAGDLNAVTERSDLTSPCWPATSPPSASPAAKKRSVEPDVIGKTSFHFGKTRVHWKKSKMAISWEKKRLIFKIFWATAPDPAGGLTAPPRPPAGLKPCSARLSRFARPFIFLFSIWRPLLTEILDPLVCTLLWTRLIKSISRQ